MRTRVRQHSRRTASGMVKVVRHDRNVGKGRSVADIGRAFWNGQSLSGGGGKAANVTSEIYDDGSGILYEYGWAILAERLSNGKVIIYDGWRGYSSTTTKHFGQLHLYAEGTNIIHSNERRYLESY